ncbi:MAG: hypothetical protein HC915_19820 [Anaerolineae bacterium]|nr:hypothetical protein [Anaerolineae bacterium]
MPVLYGDCVWDRAQTFGILSGDQLVVMLANRLGARRVGLGTNVDGVLDEAGQPLAEWRAGAGLAGVGGSGAVDVTGGMRGKLAELAALQGAEACIFNLTKPEHLEKWLAGAPVGTRIAAREENTP